MKAVSILLLLCSAASSLEALACPTEGAASKIAVDFINKFHPHGYKFNQTYARLYETELTGELCIMKMRLNLTETKCHVVNPKPYEECELRDYNEPNVDASCDVEVHVTSDRSTVNTLNCLTTKLDVEGCPGCPQMIDLNDPTGVSSVSQAVAAFNQNISSDHFYVLHEIGRIKSGYIFRAGMAYYAEFVLVQTTCPKGPNANIEACLPLCPDRARHVFCKSKYATVKGLMSVDCDLYPAKSTTVLEKEPVCPHPSGPPPATPCFGLAQYDHSLHPICPRLLPGTMFDQLPTNF